MMILIYKYCVVLVLTLKITSCYGYACPSFKFSSDGSLSARIEIPTPNNHNNVLKLNVQLLIGGKVSQEELTNKLSFLGNSDDVINKRPLVYRLELPSHWNNFQKNITKISLNDEDVCSSDHLDTKIFKKISILNLSVSLKISTSRGSGSQVPSSTLPPYSDRTITRRNSVTQSTTQLPPTVTQPLRQNFQKNYCSYSPSYSQSNFLIYRGGDAQNEMYPWVGALVQKENESQKFQCGATLITENLALTAGHCVTPHFNHELYLIFGKSNIYDYLNDDGQIAKVAKIELHPQYDANTSDADLAMLRLSKELYFTSAVKPICLCKFEDSLKTNINYKGVVAGWGTNENNKLSTSLKQSYVGIVKEEVCLWSSSSFFDITSSRTFCAGDKDGSGPCQGDSGSGFYMLVEGKWTIRGVVSRSLLGSDGRCDLSQYVVYVDVAKHLYWINTFL